MESSPSRRRFLATSTVGLTVFAGCTINKDSYSSSTADSGESDEDSRDPVNRPGEPGVQFETGLSINNTPEYSDWNNDNYNQHRNTRLFSIEVNQDGVVHVETNEPIKINREGQLSISYQRAGGSVNQTTAETLSPTEEFGERTWEFKIPDPETLPQNRKATVKLLYQDSHQFFEGVTNTLKAHNFAIIPYSYYRGDNYQFEHDRTVIVNSESLNRNFQNRTLSEPDDLYTEIGTDVNGWRIRFYVLTHENQNGEFITGYSALPAERYHNYVAAAEPQSGWWVAEGGWHPATIIYNVEDHVHLTTLADSFATSLDENGFTQRWTRLQKLAHFVGCIDSHEGLEKAPPIRTLYEHTADCTEATSLYLALINTNAFENTRSSMITCTWNGGAHVIVGIDERDITPQNPAEVKWHTPSQDRLDMGVPDTRYALAELTQPRDIGDIDEEDTEIGVVMGTSELHISSALKNPPYDEDN